MERPKRSALRFPMGKEKIKQKALDKEKCGYLK